MKWYPKWKKELAAFLVDRWCSVSVLIDQRAYANHSGLRRSSSHTPRRLLVKSTRVLLAFARVVIAWQTPTPKAFKNFHYVIAAGIGMVALTPTSVPARDLDMLTRLLIPGYIAQDFAAYCNAKNSSFLPERIDNFGSVAAYAQHLKIETTSGLTQAEAMHVMVTSANTALGVARKETRKLSESSPADSLTSARGWCDRSAKPFILEVIKLHMNKHKNFEAIVEKAKR